MEEGLLPHYRSMDDPAQMEEERRLCYVGITRAQKKVYLFRAFKRMIMGLTQANAPSRFLKDIPDHLVEGNLVPSGSNGSSGGTARPGISTGRVLAGKTGSEQQGKPPAFKAGNKVRHPQFGEGIVISIKPSGNDYEVVVAFDGEQVSLKRLLLSFARLEKV